MMLSKQNTIEQVNVACTGDVDLHNSLTLWVNKQLAAMLSHLTDG
jgi:hypothetical protein